MLILCGNGYPNIPAPIDCRSHECLNKKHWSPLPESLFHRWPLIGGGGLGSKVSTVVTESLFRSQNGWSNFSNGEFSIVLIQSAKVKVDFAFAREIDSLYTIERENRNGAIFCLPKSNMIQRETLPFCEKTASRNAEVIQDKDLPSNWWANVIQHAMPPRLQQGLPLIFKVCQCILSIMNVIWNSPKSPCRFRRIRLFFNSISISS